jgi:hypothetical protein
MSCGCKKGQGAKDNASKEMAENEINRVAFTDSIFMRSFLFLFSLAILLIAIIPIIIPMMTIMLFNRIVLRKNTNLTAPLLKLGKLMKRKKKDEDGDDEEEDEINPDDYELADVEVVK